MPLARAGDGTDGSPGVPVDAADPSGKSRPSVPTTSSAPVDADSRDGVAHGRLRAAVVGAVLSLGIVALAVGSLPAEPSRASLLLAWLTTSLVVSATGLMAYLFWRLDGRPGLAWTASALTLVGLYGTGAAALGLAGLGAGHGPTGAGLADLLVATGAALCGAAAARSAAPPRHPLLLGAAPALAAVVLSSLLPAWPGAFSTPPGKAFVAVATLGLSALAAAGVAGGRLPSHLPHGLAASVLVGAGPWALIAGLAPTRGEVEPWAGGAALVLAATAAAVVLHALRAQDREREKSLQTLTARAIRAEAAARHNQDRMHEVRATAAGVASAAEVLAHGQLDLSATRRQMLCELLVDETERLRRLTHSFERGEVTRVDLDEVVGRVVGKQRALGQVVRWEPSGLAVEADADMLQEVLDILLVNAQVHAPGAWVRVNARLRHGAAVVQVRDTGPGVAPQVADRLFERGVRGPSSSGSGVGLHLARRLTAEMGGTLRLEPTLTGTRFVLSLTRHAEEVTHDSVEPGEHPDARGAC